MQETIKRYLNEIIDVFNSISVNKNAVLDFIFSLLENGLSEELCPMIVVPKEYVEMKYGDVWDDTTILKYINRGIIDPSNMSEWGVFISKDLIRMVKENKVPATVLGDSEKELIEESFDGSELDFIFGLYESGIIEIERLSRMFKEYNELSDEGLNLVNSIFTQHVSKDKIKELYFNSLLSYQDLQNLIDNEIIQENDFYNWRAELEAQARWFAANEGKMPNKPNRETPTEVKIEEEKNPSLRLTIEELKDFASILANKHYMTCVPLEGKGSKSSLAGYVGIEIPEYRTIINWR